MFVRIGRYATDKDPEDFERKIKVEVHSFDIWNADHTLALIIHPILIKLKETKHGYPPDFCEPKDFRPNPYPETCVGGGWDAYEKILDKMIWSFQEIIDDNYLMKYYDERPGPEDKTWTHKVMEHDKKIQEGLDLFSKFFRSFWT